MLMQANEKDGPEFFVLLGMHENNYSTEFPRLDAWASISRLCVAYQASKRAEASF